MHPLHPCRNHLPEPICCRSSPSQHNGGQIIPQFPGRSCCARRPGLAGCPKAPICRTAASTACLAHGCWTLLAPKRRSDRVTISRGAPATYRRGQSLWQRRKAHGRQMCGQQRRIRVIGTRVLISGTPPRQSCTESKDALPKRCRAAGDAARQGHRPGKKQACGSKAVSAFTAHRCAPGFSALMASGCFSN